MQSFRFIHTGDIHLDSPLKGLSGQQGAAAECIRTATRTAFDTLVSQAIEEEVDFFVIAGDLYDGDWRDYQTGLFFAKQMGRLAEVGIPAFLLYGNHDAESQITRRLSPLKHFAYDLRDIVRRQTLPGYRLTIDQPPDVPERLAFAPVDPATLAPPGERRTSRAGDKL